MAMRAAAQMNCPPEVYLAYERHSAERHEYLAGEVFAMTGASERHNLIVATQDRPHLEQFVRQPDGQWLLAEWQGRDATVHLPSIDVGLVLAEVYDKVDV